MATFLMIANSKLGYVVSIRKNQILLQMAKGAKLGKDVVQIGTLIRNADNEVDYRLDKWIEFSEQLEKLEDAQKIVKVAKDFKLPSDATEADKRANRKTLNDSDKAVELAEAALMSNPIRQFSEISVADIIKDINKLLTQASKNLAKVSKDGSIEFSTLISNDAFLEQEAKQLAKLHNESLTRQGLEVGFMDIETARSIVASRYADSKILLAARTAKKIKVDTFNQ